MKTTASTEVEWVTIAPDKVVVANAERVWLDSLLDDDDRYTETITGTGNTAITRNLLDGVMAAAKVAIPVSKNPPPLTPNRLVWHLAGAYQTAHATPTLMEEAGQRFASANRHALSNWAFEKAKEETGHDRLALLDIKSLGYRAEELVQAIIPPAAMVLVDYFKRSVQYLDPIDCVGYVHALERMSLGGKKEHIQKIDALVPLKVNATRFLRMHSSMGSDVKHVEDNVEMIVRLSYAERTRVIRACYETALLLFSPPRDGYLSEAELEDMLKPYKLEP
ncbi:MAG: hypothetical protein AAF383_22645 [Cyanobacteria bacterium P01_A01_bin.83]